MPGYKRKTYRSKRTFKKRKAYKGVAAGVKALQIVRKMQNAVEYKHNDYPSMADDLVGTGTSYNLLDTLQKGDNSFQRTGDIIKLARASILLTVAFPTGETLPAQSRSFRIMLVRGIRENTVKPEMAISSSASKGVLDNTNAPVVLSRKALDNMRDTKILFDKVYTLTPGQVTKKELRYNFKLGWLTRFGTGSSNINVPEDGGLYLMCCEDFNNGDLLISLNTRVTFSDI